MPDHTLSRRELLAADDLQLVNKITYWESNGQITRRVNISA